MKIDKKALKILLNYDLLNPEQTPQEDFEYAKHAGYMFESIQQTHDGAVQMAVQEKDKCEEIKVTDLFLSSLSTKRLEWRIGLSAYVIMRMFPFHSFTGEGMYCETCSCLIEEYVDRSFINSIRYDVGGIISGDIYDLAFILQQHNTISSSCYPKEEDFNIFKQIIHCLKNAKENETPSSIQKAIAKIENFTSNQIQRKAILETLGFCSILETNTHKGFLRDFTNLNLAPSSRHRSDWLYPVDWWKGRDGLNYDALRYWFGKYKELEDVLYD